MLLLSLLPLYWTALYTRVLPFPLLGDEVALEAYRFYGGDSEDSLPAQLVGGGYQWFPEGSDLWIRFQSKERQSKEHYEAQNETLLCEPEKLAKVSQWFSRHVRTPQDQENLKDHNSLVCSTSDSYKPIEDEGHLGIPITPNSCSEFWELRHIPTCFVYFRFRCDVI